ncbi:PepSY domain-containing protein [Roseovarius sp.]|uniref:PepSY domain-containing protein n=1 Tax=Roseovarius sp. TaxID=1486281 RepID=UPI0025ED2F9F|nr:PepSY domain-containing protein [Roseovarius sp.]
MTRILALSLALLAGSLVTAEAETPKVTSKPDAVVTEQITAKLSEEGYEVRKVKTEDGLYEAYALKNGEKFEIFMDADLNVVRTKSE